MGSRISRSTGAVIAVLVVAMVAVGLFAFRGSEDRTTAASPTTAASAPAPQVAAPASGVAPSPSAATGEPESVSAVQLATVGPSLTFATWNVCKVGCAAPAPAWETRRDRIGRVIAESGADVLGLQEITNYGTAIAKTQVDDVKALLAPLGYAAVTIDPNSADNGCRRPRDANGQLAGPSPCENTAMLLYRTSSVAEFDTPSGSNAGRIMAGDIVGGMSPDSATRSIEWAYLRGLNGAGPFLAFSMHTDSAKTAQSEADRVALANALGAWANNMNAAHGMPASTPVVMMADLNSYAKRQPNGAQKIMTNQGWQDSWNAPSRANIQYSTINYNPMLADGSGFPVRPYVFRKSKKNRLGEATRIDYIMAWGPGVKAVDYRVVIYLNADGTFNQDYQGSDHQMVRAVLQFG
jgi:endonuclease/exonuclease/phosphatase family metal-dependent hydrolase